MKMTSHYQSQAHSQAPFQSQMPPQQQNMGQPRQGQQSNQTPMQQKGNQASQNQQSSYPTYAPQLALWTLEKPKDADSWGDVEPEQQHVRLQDLQSDLTKFRRSGVSVKRALKEIKSSTARKIVNDLVDDQNQELWRYNRTLQWTIGSIEVEWKSISSRSRRLRRIDVILETEPSGFVEPVRPKGNNSNNAYDIHDPMRAVKGNGMSQDQQFRNQGMNPGQGNGQNAKNNQNQLPNMGNNQFFDQQQMRMQPQMQTNPPPPPPPPNGGQSHSPVSGMMGPPPPPPPPNGATRQQQHVQQPVNFQQPVKNMPGAYPESGPHMGMKHTHRMPLVENLTPHVLKSQKSKSKSKLKNIQGYPSESSDWESETDSSGTDSFGVRAIDDLDSGMNGARGRPKHAGHVKHPGRSLSRHRSVSRGRGRVTKPYKEKLSHMRSRSFSTGPTLLGTLSGRSSKNHSPRSSVGIFPMENGGATPAQVHIHINKDGEATRDFENGRDREKRRSIHNTSPSDFRKNSYHKSEKIGISQPMARGTSSGSNRSYGSDFSIADDSVFSSPQHSRSNSEVGAQTHLRSRNYSRPQHQDFNQPHPSQIYDVDRRPRPRYPVKDYLQQQRARHSYLANDYPHQQRVIDSFHEGDGWSHRPSIPHRRNSVQIPNPFEPGYPTQRSAYNEHVREPRYITDKQQDGVDLRDLADAIEHIKHTRRQPLRRSHTISNRIDPNDWEPIYPGGYASTRGGPGYAGGYGL